MKNTLIIPPQGKRKHKIIIEAHFAKLSKEEQEALDNKIAMTLGKMGLFDDFIKEEEKAKNEYLKKYSTIPNNSN